MEINNRAKYLQDWRNKHSGYLQNWREKHLGYANQASKKYNQSKKGKITRKKTKAKRRNMNWILMFPNPFDDSVLVDYHHITDVYVVAIPRDLHKLYLGKYHRENTMEIVKQIYLGDSNGNR